MTAIAFFHQNDVFSRQGGIERYVATLLDCAQGRAALVSPPLARPYARHFAVEDSGPHGAPQWLRFVGGLFAQRHAIRSFLRENGVGVLEFSRPEYMLAGWLFPGAKVVTIHGTGPDKSQRLHHLVHHLCCLLLPLLVHRVQVIGRDRSGLPRIAQKLLGARIVHIDAWCDDRFRPTPTPPIAYETPLRVFYAGRVAAQKDPALLFEIVQKATTIYPKKFEFRYFGSDYAAFVKAGVGDLVMNSGFLDVGTLAMAIGSCHVGILCSAYGEGSPFIVVETLACGRPFVLPPLPTLVEAYDGAPGALIVARREADGFVEALMNIRAKILAGHVGANAIASGVADRAQSRAAPRLLAELVSLARSKGGSRAKFSSQAQPAPSPRKRGEGTDGALHHRLWNATHDADL
ncbi:MAG TPA: glycosyltransferase [Methylocystis sp.]|nr:glycosyltransferase [Methylocystis sp.]